MLDFLNNGTAPLNFHETHIVLIPKVKSPTKVSEYRPISLSNVVYKLASKVLANRLKTFLPSLITENQSAFLSQRLITDNVLVAFEIMNSISQRRSGKTGSMALKLDMSKAFDRVEWSSLEQIMRKMGFHSKWITMVMNCVTSVTCSIRINGVPHGRITPSRGLRQGDPLSPYLFLLCAESLLALIHNAIRISSLRGLQVCKWSPHITHLFFADDSLLFSNATVADCKEIQRLLLVYERATGQQVNMQKTSLYFNLNTPEEIQEYVKQSFGANIIRQHQKYLGLPSLVGRNKLNTFQQLKERVSSKLTGWKEKFLSGRKGDIN